MPIKKESHAKRASISLTPRFHRRGTPAFPPIYRNPKMRNEPNPTRPTAKKYETNPIYPTNFAKRTQSLPGKNAKRTQFTPPPPLPKTQKCETNPIPVPPASRRPPKPPLCKTNPISAPPHVSRLLPRAAFRETNPIYPYPSLAHDPKRETNPISPPQHPDYAKRTQFPTTNIQSTIYNIQYTIPWPNSQPPICNLQYTLYNLLAQFHPTACLIPTYCLNPGFLGFSFEKGIPF